MEKPFEIGTIDKRKKIAIIYSTNFHRLEEYMDSVGQFLKKNTFRGKVIFDLLLSNGTSNRFIEVIFNGNNFDTKTLKSINKVDDIIIENSLVFYSNNPSLLENSILSKAQRFLIKRKIKLS